MYFVQDFNTKNSWNQSNMSANLYSNYMMKYSQVLDFLSQVTIFFGSVFEQM